MGVGHTDNKSAHFDSESENLFLVLMTGLELRSWNLESDALVIDPPLHYPCVFIYVFIEGIINSDSPVNLRGSPQGFSPVQIVHKLDSSNRTQVGLPGIQYKTCTLYKRKT